MSRSFGSVFDDDDGASTPTFFTNRGYVVLSDRRWDGQRDCSWDLGTVTVPSCMRVGLSAALNRI
jgi:hypothetical protein